MLWKLPCSLLFGKNDVCCKSKDQTHKLVQDKREIVLHRSTEDVDPSTSINWREAFKRKYIGNPSWRSISNRVLCGHCESIIWLSNIRSAGTHRCHNLESPSVKVRPISSYKVAEYLLGESTLTMSSSDSDDSDGDSDGSSPLTRRLPKLWAFPRLTKR